jgi:hypothetical protein
MHHVIKHNRPVTKRKGKEEGHSILEFALVAMPTVIMLLGVVVVGVDLGRASQVTEICRDAAAMYVRGIDFSQAGNQQELVRLGQNMNLQVSSGDGLVTLSKITFIPDPSCGTPPDPNCTNGKNVLMQRIIFGNTSLQSTHFPTAGGISQDAQGNVANYATDPDAVITNFVTNGFQLKPNEISYVAETFFRTTDVSMAGFQSSPGIYAQSFF